MALMSSLIRQLFLQEAVSSKNKLLAFTLKERCQHLSSSFNCLIRNRRGCQYSEQARTGMGKPTVLYSYHGKFTGRCGSKPTRGCRRLEKISLSLQTHKQSTLPSFLCKANTEYFSERCYKDASAQNKSESWFVQLSGTANPPLLSLTVFVFLV